MFTKHEQVLLIQLKKTLTRIQKYFEHLNTFQDFTQDCIITRIQGHNVDTKVVEENPQSFAFEGTQGTGMKIIQTSLMCNMLKYFGWMMQIAIINVIVLSMFSIVSHSLVQGLTLEAIFSL